MLENKQAALLSHPRIRTAEMIVTSFSLCAFPFRGRFTLCSFENIPHLSKGKNRGVVHLKMWCFTFCLQKSTSYQLEPKLYSLNISADSNRYWPPKNDAIYNLFTNLLTILPIRRGSFANKIATFSLYKGLCRGNWANKIFNPSIYIKVVFNAKWPP